MRTLFRRTKDLPIETDIFDDMFRKAAREAALHVLTDQPIKLARILEEKPPSHEELMKLWTAVKNGEFVAK